MTVTDARARADFARVVRDLTPSEVEGVDGRHRYADEVVPVMDDPNTHAVASLYAAFPPAEARRGSPTAWGPTTRRSTAAGRTWPSAG